MSFLLMEAALPDCQGDWDELPSSWDSDSADYLDEKLNGNVLWDLNWSIEPIEEIWINVFDGFVKENRKG